MRRTIALAAVVALVVVALVVVARAQPQAPAAPAQAAPPGPPKPTVRIIILTVPMKKAMVFWGKKRLGVIAPHQPLVVDRPRDSGPLDVVVRADGYVPVQTRAYTFADSKLAVKLTPLDQKNTLLGYREELAPDGGAPEGGTPSAAGLPAGPDGGAR
jgi:hypothetical protein